MCDALTVGVESAKAVLGIAAFGGEGEPYFVCGLVIAFGVGGVGVMGSFTLATTMIFFGEGRADGGGDEQQGEDKQCFFMVCLLVR